MKIPSIIIGTNGQVGSALLHEFRERNESIWCTSRTFVTDFGEGKFFLDLEKNESITALFAAFAKEYPGATTTVYLTGALTHVDRCEAEPDLCERINVQGPLKVISECEKYGHRLVFFSSEYVFGEAEYHDKNEIGPFVESDPPAPSSVYGKSKLTVEQAIQKSRLQKPLILRTTMVFSAEDPKKMNFVYQILQRLESGEKIRVPSDQISTPSYAPDLVKAAMDLVARGESGVFHLVSAEKAISRPEFVQMIAEMAGKKVAAGQLEAISTAEMKQPARRPLTAGLKSERGIHLRGLAECLRDFKKRIST